MDETECDFPDLTERHIMSVDECYATPGGKIHLGGYRSVDSIIGVRDEYLIVLETTDPDIQRGATFNKIQEDGSVLFVISLMLLHPTQK